MASIIRIKRSSVSGNPTTLAAGELAYSALADNGSNGGDRLYIGMGTETAGNAANHLVIGGKFFTDRLDHDAGVLTASSALVVDANKKIDDLLVDNIELNGNSITTTNTNGDLSITPNGTGKTIVTNLYIGDSATPLSEYIYDTVGGQVTGGTGITVTNNDVNNTSTVSITNTGITAGTYGSASAIPVLTINAQGQVTAVSTATTSSTLSLAGDTGTDTVTVGVDTLTFVGGTGLTSAVINNTVTLDIDSTVATLTGTQTLSNKSLQDSTTFFVDETDATKKLQFQLSGIATGTTRTLTVPNVSDTIAVLGTAQTFTAAQTIRAAGGIRSEAAASQDAVVLAGRAGGASSYAVTVTPTTLTGNRTLTLADGNTTLQAGTMATTGGTLGQFAATTSAQLAGVISDETGSGALVFAVSPTLTTPNIGVATATTVNKVAITAPATGSTLTIADGKTLTASNTLTLTGTDGSSVAFGAGGTVAYTSSKLSSFAATTSAELAGVISDETGSGALVFANSPTLTTPNLGVASATSLNKVTITAPATSATLTLANGSTLATVGAFSTTFTSTGATAVTLPTTGTLATLTGTETLTNKSISGSTNTLTNIGNASLVNSAVTFGSTTVSLGATSTSIAGLTEVTVDNLNINGNTISSTNANGNISLDPNGTGTVEVNGARITGLATPVNGTDAATKTYVDETAQGVSVKPAVRAATTGPLTATYYNGAANDGVGATLTLPAAATLNIDGITDWAQYAGILVKDQTSAFQNGRYYVDVVGNISTPWVLTRCIYCDQADEIPSSYVFVQEGTTYASTGWVAVVADSGAFDVGVDAITWTQFSGAGTYLAGNGLSITGSTFNVGAGNGITVDSDTVSVSATIAGNGLTYTSGVVNAVGTANRISVTADAIDIASTYVGQNTITTLGTITTGVWNGTAIADAYVADNLTISGGTINNTPVGATTRSTGAFTTLAASGAVTFSSTLGVTSNATVGGTLGVTGATTLSSTLGVTGNVTLSANLTGSGSSVLSGFDIDGGTY